MSSRFKRVCVYCGSSSGNSPEFLEMAAELGEALVDRGVGLVYGGGSIGLMGKVSNTVHERGGAVLGVIPVALEPVEVSGKAVGETVVVADMHERKAMMVREPPPHLPSASIPPLPSASVTPLPSSESRPYS